MISFSSVIPTLVFLLLVGNVIGHLEKDHHPQQQRQLQGDGGGVLVEAFVCDEDFNIMSEDQVVNKGDSIRICIKTHVRAKVQGISIAKMIDFFLLREFENGGSLEQILLQAGIVASDGDELTCQPGSELCVLESIPMDSFFGRDGRVDAIGSVLLQYDDNDDSDSYPTAMPTTVVVSTPPPTRAPTVPPTAYRTETTAPTSAPPQDDTTTTLVTPQSNANHRQLLLPDPPKVILETSFTVVTAGDDTGFLTDFREHWDSSPAYVKVLYVLAFIFFFLILFVLGCGMLVWAGFCNKTMVFFFPERFQREREGVVSSKGSIRDDHTIDESVGAFSPFARNNNNKEEEEEEEVLFMDQYNDEPQSMPRQIAFQRSMSASVLSTDFEASVGQEEDTLPGGRKRKPRNPAAAGANRSGAGRKSIRDRNVAQKARLARSGNRQTINPNRDLAASFLGGYPKRKLASVRSKTPRSIHDRNRPTVVGDEIPREKTASAVRWLREKDQQQQQQLQQSSRSVSSAPPLRRGVNQQLQGSTHSSGLDSRRGGIVLHGNSIPKPPRSTSRGVNQQRRGSSHSVSTAPPPRSSRRVNQQHLQGSSHSVSTAPPPRSTRGFNQHQLQGSTHSVSTAPPPRSTRGFSQQQFQGSTHVSGLSWPQKDVTLDNSSQSTPPQTKRVFRHEKRVSIDIMPMTPDEIDWAMEDAKTQEEEREIQEIRERIRRRKEAKARAAAAAIAPRWGAIVSHDGNSLPQPALQQRRKTPPNMSPKAKRRTSDIPVIPEVETVFSDPESLVETVCSDQESVESVDHDYVDASFLADKTNIPHGRDNPRPVD